MLAQLLRNTPKVLRRAAKLLKWAAQLAGDTGKSKASESGIINSSPE